MQEPSTGLISSMRGVHPPYVQRKLDQVQIMSEHYQKLGNSLHNVPEDITLVSIDYHCEANSPDNSTTSLVTIHLMRNNVNKIFILHNDEAGEEVMGTVSMVEIDLPEYKRKLSNSRYSSNLHPEDFGNARYYVPAYTKESEQFADENTWNWHDPNTSAIISNLRWLYSVAIKLDIISYDAGPLGLELWWNSQVSPPEWLEEMSQQFGGVLIGGIDYDPSIEQGSEMHKAYWDAMRSGLTRDMARAWSGLQ